MWWKHKLTPLLLDHVMKLQIDSHNMKPDEPNLHASIVASFGTGEKELAATAALNHKTVHPLQFGDGNQRFYQAHMTQSPIMFNEKKCRGKQASCWCVSEGLFASCLTLDVARKV